MDLLTAFALALNPPTPDVVAFVGGGGKTATVFRLAGEIAAAGRRVVTTTSTRIGAHQVALSPAVVVAGSGTLPLDKVASALDRCGQCLLVGALEHDDDMEKRAGVTAQQMAELVTTAGRLAISAILVEADGSRMLPIKAPGMHEPAVPDLTTLLAPVVGLSAVGRRIEAGQVHRPERIRALLGLAAGTADRLTPRMLADLMVHELGGAKNRPLGARLLPLFNQAERPPALAAAALGSQTTGPPRCILCDRRHRQRGRGAGA